MSKKERGAKFAAKDFTTLAIHDATTAKEGQITNLNFERYTIGRLIHNADASGIVPPKACG